MVFIISFAPSEIQIDLETFSDSSEYNWDRLEIMAGQDQSVVLLLHAIVWDIYSPK